MVDVRQAWPKRKPKSETIHDMARVYDPYAPPTGTLRLWEQRRNRRWVVVDERPGLTLKEGRQQRGDLLGEWIPDRGRGAPVVLGTNAALMDSFRASGLGAKHREGAVENGVGIPRTGLGAALRVAAG